MTEGEVSDAGGRRGRGDGEVVALAARGLSNHEIARELVVSPATAKTHTSRSMIELDARDRAQLVVIGDETGLVRPGWTA